MLQSCQVAFELVDDVGTVNIEKMTFNVKETLMPNAALDEPRSIVSFQKLEVGETKVRDSQISGIKFSIAKAPIDISVYASANWEVESQHPQKIIVAHVQDRDLDSYSVSESQWEIWLTDKLNPEYKPVTLTQETKRGRGALPQSETVPAHAEFKLVTENFITGVKDTTDTQ